MADRRGQATWLVIAVVLLGVVAVANLPGRRSLTSDGAEHPRLAALMGSAHRASDGQVFTGAELTAMMGSCSLDLTHAQMAPGAEATIDVFAMMGSITIRVPEGWTIDAHAVPVMGGVQDRRWQRSSSQQETSSFADPPRVVLRGLVMMGSLFLRS